MVYFSLSYKIFFFLQILTILTSISSKTCGNPAPKSFVDCSPFSNKDNTCCFVNVGVLSNNETLCLEIPEQQKLLTPYITGLDIGIANNKIDLIIDCGQHTTNLTNLNNTFSLCGTNPSKKEDCFSNSTTTASCCLLENPDETKYCILNSEVKKFTKTYYGVKIECGCNFIFNKIYYLLLLYLFPLFM